MQLISVLRTIELDNKLRFQTKEVCDKGSDWMLAAELESFELPRAQARPQFLFGVRLIESQPASGVAS